MALTFENLCLSQSSCALVYQSVAQNIESHSSEDCNTLQHTATHCNTLQHPTTPCNTLQHTAAHNFYPSQSSRTLVHQSVARKI